MFSLCLQGLWPQYTDSKWRNEREIDWLFVSTSQPCDEVPTCPG